MMARPYRPDWMLKSWLETRLTPGASTGSLPIRSCTANGRPITKIAPRKLPKGLPIPPIMIIAT